MTDQMKNILIGLFVTGALTIMIAMVLFLEPRVGDGKKILKVRFANVSGISVGTRVTFAGKPVGEVTHIREVADARQETPDDTGRIYIYELTLKVDSSVDVYKNDEIAMKTTGLMGERSIGITPKSPPKGQIPQPIAPNQIIYANSVDALENTFNQVSRVANRLESTIVQFDRWFTDNEQNLSQALSSFGGAMSKVDTVLSSVDEEQIVSSARESLDLLNENMQFVRSSLDNDQLLHKFANLATNLDRAADTFNSEGAQTLRHLNQISRDIASGTGSLGRFITGDDFYLRLSSIMTKGETLMNDINHYGVLFQYNKQWQRGRAKKASLLNSLGNPQEFRNYFEGEIDSMTTSLGRLTELVDRADAQERTHILQSDAYKHNLAALLRQVQGFHDSLKLYNQELVGNAE